MEDKLVLGGKEFSSRFILGSGKYNINLIKAAVEQGGAEIITLALRRAIPRKRKYFGSYPGGSNITGPILPVPETQKKQCVLPD